MGDLTARGGGDRLSLLRDAVATPVRISRRDLRRMSDEEVTLRKSALRESEVPPQGELPCWQSRKQKLESLAVSKFILGIVYSLINCDSN